MLLMTGVLLNVFENPKGVSKDGKEFGGQDKIQVLGEVLLQNGEVKRELVDLTCHDVGYFSPHLNESISFPIGVMSAAKNQTVFFIPKGSKPNISSI